MQANITVQGQTGWIDALDPLYAAVADLWMRTLVQDFGTDHWYQLDGYFNGGTAPWMQSSAEGQSHPVDAWVDATTARAPMLPGAAEPGHPAAAAGAPGSTAPSVVVADAEWYRRGTAAYEGLNRTDPEV